MLPGVPDAAPWTALDSDAERTNFYGGPATIELYRPDTSGYRDNLATGEAVAVGGAAADWRRAAL